MIVRILQYSISLYQKTLSPDTGFIRVFFPHGFCRYHPTCSAYMKEALGRHGMVRGFSMGVWRIVRCNPYSQGGFDPVK